VNCFLDLAAPDWFGSGFPLGILAGYSELAGNAFRCCARDLVTYGPWREQQARASTLAGRAQRFRIGNIGIRAYRVMLVGIVPGADAQYAALSMSDLVLILRLFTLPSVVTQGSFRSSRVRANHE